jgi:GMP reductase
MLQQYLLQVDSRGDVTDTMQDILGGLRSAWTDVGAGKIKEMPKRTTFIRVTQQINEIYGAHAGGSDRS